jgi:hypothetical protein
MPWSNTSEEAQRLRLVLAILSWREPSRRLVLSRHLHRRERVRRKKAKSWSEQAPPIAISAVKPWCWMVK